MNYLDLLARWLEPHSRSIAGEPAHQGADASSCGINTRTLDPTRCRHRTRGRIRNRHGARARMPSQVCGRATRRVVAGEPVRVSARGVILATVSGAAISAVSIVALIYL